MKDWTLIKADYIRNGGSLRALAARHDVSFHSVAKACRRENWPLLRRIHGDGEGDRTATPMATRSDNPATGAEPSALSLPQRSANLRGALVRELERDAKVVAATPPANLEISQQRQDVVSAITRNAGTVLQWNDPKPTPAVRIDVMASCFFLNEQGQAVYADGIRPPPADLPQSALPELMEGSEPE